MISTKFTAKELEKFVSQPGMDVLRPWMEAVQQSLAAVAAQVDTDRGSGTNAVAALKVEE